VPLLRLPFLSPREGWDGTTTDRRWNGYWRPVISRLPYLGQGTEGMPDYFLPMFVTGFPIDLLCISFRATSFRLHVQSSDQQGVLSYITYTIRSPLARAQMRHGPSLSRTTARSDDTRFLLVNCAKVAHVPPSHHWDRTSALRTGRLARHFRSVFAGSQGKWKSTESQLAHRDCSTSARWYVMSSRPS